MVEISFTHIVPPGKNERSEAYYRKGWNFANDALGRYGVEVCARMRKCLTPAGAYEQGAADRLDGKPHRYGKPV